MNKPSCFGIWGNTEKDEFWNILPKIIQWADLINLDVRLTQRILSDARGSSYDFDEITSKAEISFKENLETSAQTIKAKGKKCSLCWKINENACHRTHCPQNF